MVYIYFKIKELVLMVIINSEIYLQEWNMVSVAKNLDTNMS